MKKKQMQQKITELETRVAALEKRIFFLEHANACRKYNDLGGNHTHKYDWWKNAPTCETNYNIETYLV